MLHGADVRVVYDFVYSKVKVNGKVLPVHVTKTFGESRDKAALFLNLRTTWN
jgi:hypothetical protein